MEYDVNAIKAAIFDQKAYYELGDQRIDSQCLQPVVGLNNELSYQEEIQDNSSLFNFNSYNDNESQHDNEMDNILNNDHIRTSQEDDYVLRVESKRAGFASKYLFNKGVQEEVEEEEESYENESSSDFSQTDAFGSVASPEMSCESITVTPLKKAVSQETPEVSFLTPVIQSHDMFFSCCDWETAMEVEKKGQTAHKSFHAPRSDIDSLFVNKRVRKMSEKLQEPQVSKFSD